VWVRPNATAAEAIRGIPDFDRHFDLVLFVSLALILMQFMDCAVQVALYGVFEPDLDADVLTDSAGGDNQRSTSSTGKEKVEKVASTTKATCWSRPLSELRTGICIHIFMLWLVAIDWIVQFSTRYKMSNNADSVLILPITAFLRPVIFAFRFEKIGRAGSNLLKTLFFGMDVLALFLSIVVISATMGVVLLRNSYGENGLFESVPSAVMQVFIFLLTAENHPDVVYGPTGCDSFQNKDLMLPEMNTLLGGVVSQGCPNWGHHPVFIMFEVLGLFFIVALVIAVFESFYSDATQKEASAARKSRRMGIIAAFILLDKSGDGALDKTELLEFLNDTAGLDFDIDMDDDLELNGIEFVEVRTRQR
jgi:hypothetical protein